MTGRFFWGMEHVWLPSGWWKSMLFFSLFERNQTLVMRHFQLNGFIQRLLILVKSLFALMIWQPLCYRCAILSVTEDDFHHIKWRTCFCSCRSSDDEGEKEATAGRRRFQTQLQRLRHHQDSPRYLLAFVWVKYHIVTPNWPIISDEYVHLYVYMCVCVYRCLYLCVYIQTCTHTHVLINICTLTLNASKTASVFYSSKSCLIMKHLWYLCAHATVSSKQLLLKQLGIKRIATTRWGESNDLVHQEEP